MRKWINAVLAVALCLALSVALTACSDSTATSSDGVSESTVEGKWDVVAIQDGYETLTGTTLEAIGQGTTFGFDADGSCYADTAGNVLDGTWSLSGDTLTMTFGSDKLTATVKSNEIVVGEDGGMTLQRAEQQD